MPLPCSFMMEYDIHTLLDFLTLLATVWVIYMLRFPLRSSYQDKEDSLKFYFVVSLVEGLLCCTGGAMQHPVCAPAMHVALEQQKVLLLFIDWLAEL